MIKHDKPKAREKNLIVQEMGEETVVYDATRHEAICLNAIAASVWKLCDGKRSAREITIALNHIDADFEDVQLALERLSRSKLLQTPYRAPQGTFETTHRRDVLKKLAATSAFGAPLIASITAPTAAQAASCVPPGGMCSDISDCCDDCGGIQIIACLGAIGLGICTCVDILPD